MARAPTSIPAKQALPGKTLVGRLLGLEAIVVALGAGALPKDEKARVAVLEEMRKDAMARAHSTGHDEVKEATDAYLDEIFEAMTTASQT